MKPSPSLLTPQTSRSPRNCVILCLSCLALLAAGCEPAQPTEAVDILGTEESQFANTEMDQLVQQRTINVGGSSQQQQKLDLSLVTPQHFLVLHVNGNQLRQYFQSRDKDLDQQLLEPKPEGLSLEPLASILFMLDDSLLQSFTPGGRMNPTGWSAQLTFDQPVDQNAWQTWLLGTSPRSVQLASHSALLSEDGSLGVMWLDELKAVVGSEKELRNIEKRLGQTLPSQVSRRLQEGYDDQFLFGTMQAEPLQKLVDQAAQMAATFGQVDERLNMAVEGARALEFVQLEASLSQDQLGRIQMQFYGEDAAKGIQSLVNQAIDQMASMAKQSAAAAEDRPGPTAGISTEVQKLLADVQQELANGGLKAELEQRTLTILLERPKEFDALIDQSLDGWQVAKRRIYQTRKIGTVARAIQVYQKQNNQVPSNQVILQEDTEAENAPKFSWRVAILPQLGYQELYDQFDFTQAWDSDHNRNVAKKMPAVFAWDDVPETGEREWIENEADTPTTSLLMVTGAGGPGKKNLVRLAELDDGADRTLLIQRVPGAEVAWTCPDEGWVIQSASDLVSHVPSPDDVVLAILYSGRVMAIRPDLSPDEWFSWITPDGKERVNRTQFQKDTVFPPAENLE